MFEHAVSVEASNLSEASLHGICSRDFTGSPGGFAASHLLAAMLNEVDYGMLMVSGSAILLHANHAARVELDPQHPLRLDGPVLRARNPRDSATLRTAIDDACRYCKRRLMTLGDDPQRVTIAVVPLLTATAQSPVGALMMLGKRQVCQALSVEAFARSHGLTSAETVVLRGLCCGSRPVEIAALHGVALSTVRTQVSKIRSKTGAGTINSLVRMVAMLPPLVSALRHAVSAARDVHGGTVVSAHGAAYTLA